MPVPSPPPAGYSGTPLVKKLGLRDGQKVLFLGLPAPLLWLRSAAAFADVADAPEPLADRDVVHAFFTGTGALAVALPGLRQAMRQDGMLWISWPKKAARMASDLGEDAIRAIALPTGLVDVKVCAVDAVWSGLKLVIRKELRRPG